MSASIDASAIEKLAGWQTDIAKTIKDQTAGRALFVPPGVQLDDAEKFMPAPFQHRHTFRTSRLDDLIAYATSQSADYSEECAPTAYVNRDGKGAAIIFDHGTQIMPLWGHHRAYLTLESTQAWTALIAMCGQSHPQLNIIQWLEDWGDLIAPHIEDAPISLQRAIHVLRRIKLEAKANQITAEGDFSSSKSTMENIEASGDTDALPTHFILSTPVYDGTPEQKIIVKLYIKSAAGTPVLGMRIVGKETLLNNLAKWVEDQIKTRLKDRVTAVYTGEIHLHGKQA